MFAILPRYRGYACSQPRKVQALTGNYISAYQNSCFNFISRGPKDFEPDGPVSQIDRVPLPHRFRQVRICDRDLAFCLGGFGCQVYSVEPSEMHRLLGEFSHSELRTGQVLKNGYWAAKIVANFPD